MRYNKEAHEEMMAAVQAALDDGAGTPSAVLYWLEDNGFEPLPTRATVIVAMQKCGYEYIAGYWVKTK